MEFRHNIILSVVIHATLIIAVSSIAAGRDAVVRLPERTISVALLEGLEKNVSSPALVKKNNTYTGLRPEMAKKESVLAQPGQVEKPEQKNPPQSEAIGKSESRDGLTDKTEIGTDNAGVILQSQGPGRGNALPGNHQGSSSGVTQAREGGPNGNGGIRTGKSDVIGMIRAAIEKTKNYPPLAKKRGIEGTATTEFTINSGGHPENIRILRSSGSDILDTAAKNTVLRASPFPLINGSIEVPITFRLNEE
jgi:TonB family protein